MLQAQVGTCCICLCGSIRSISSASHKTPPPSKMGKTDCIESKFKSDNQTVQDIMNDRQWEQRTLLIYKSQSTGSQALRQNSLCNQKETAIFKT